MITQKFIQNATEPYNGAEERANRQFFSQLTYATASVGLLLVLAYIVQFLLTLTEHCQRRGRVHWLWLTSNTFGEARSKKSAIRKINRMLLNACDMHTFDDDVDAPAVNHPTSFALSITNRPAVDRTMLNYVLRGQRLEDTGGLFWAWKQIFTGRLFDTEGIWLPTRLVVFQGAQIIITILLSLILLAVSRIAAEEAEKARAELDPTLPQWVKDIIPTKQDVYYALFPAASVSIVVMICLVLLYIPSACSTIILYRCGQIPSLGSRYFLKYRNAVDVAYMNTGNAIFGILGSAVLFYLLIGLVIFLFTYDATEGFMIRVAVWGLGLTITVMLKVVLVKTCRTTMYKSFFRTKPKSANLSALALECWFIGLGPSVLIGRITQFLCAAVFWVSLVRLFFLSAKFVGTHVFFIYLFRLVASMSLSLVKMWRCLDMHLITYLLISLKICLYMTLIDILTWNDSHKCI